MSAPQTTTGEAGSFTYYPPYYPYKYVPVSTHGPCPTCGKCQCCDEKKSVWFTPTVPYYPNSTTDAGTT